MRNENKSLGGNLTWKAPGGVTMTLDAHHSTAESKPNSPYGISNSVGTAVFGIQNQTLNFDHELPVISYNMYPGIDALNAANIVPTGNAFRNAYFRDEINQVQLRGHYDHGHGFMDSLDWGTEYTDNQVRSAYSVLQNDTWGGTGGDSAAQRAAAAALLPDSLFQLTSIPDKFAGISGSNDPNIIKSFYSFDLPSVVKLLDQAYKICGGNGQCLIPYNTDSRIHEKTMSAYAQFNGKFDLFSRTAHLIAGLRFENTDVSASALVPTPWAHARIRRTSSTSCSRAAASRRSRAATRTGCRRSTSISSHWKTSSCVHRTATRSPARTITACRADAASISCSVSAAAPARSATPT